MAKKNVTITISNPPHGNNCVVEGLKIAVGLCAGTDEHNLTVIFCGDGIFNLLSDISWDETSSNCWKMVKKLGLTLYVDEESMLERGVQEADIDEPVKLVNRTDITKLLKNSDLHMDF